MADIFRFKQFGVDQSGCAMKINTDGVLLGALAQAENPQSILDIGTGTGVIALMLAQRFTDAQIDAVEIDAIAAETAGNNFKNSPFVADRLTVFPVSFESFFEDHPEKKYDLIISNPPFHINSLESPKAKKTLAKHADGDFFEILIKYIAEHLTENGLCWLVLPLETSALVKALVQQYRLYLQKVIAIHSFEESAPHREVVRFGLNEISEVKSKMVIYEAVNKYSEEYKKLLHPYFIAF
ncbi:tRNA1Val (adenine37-N6)-methyltransferase [Mucilaginibacter mallensis]|uniref:tRNA1(Val) (adenine(37)-N6)-methyltransferase n=1 Tax=Mucilaginibacter mallensis TaxID=652787 RepID=A0A1H1TY41_MUCMA|nr:methyltransferase [Mucilaginibacter mallensis]SDS65142.1 tRNA1Val (adenine37-N6)-methyltransferase [Mucilaginibacter mallensis]